MTAQIPPEEVSAHVEDLLAGRREACRARARRLLDAGTSLRELYSGLFTTSLVEVGRRWQQGNATVADEHLATALTEDLLVYVFPRALGARRNGLRAVVSCAANELHQVGGRIVADVLELQGWHVDFLGANLPADALAGLVQKRRPHLVGLSVALEENLGRVAEAVAQVRAVAPEVPVVVGGQAFGSGAARQAVVRLPGVRYLATLQEVEALAGELGPSGG